MTDPCTRTRASRTTTARHLLLQAIVAIGVGLAFVGCTSETPVALNQQVFDTEGNAVGAGCMHLALGSKERFSTSSGTSGSKVVIHVSAIGETVRVRVLEGEKLLAESVYDEGFFMRRETDELHVTDSAGNLVEVRHWGALQEGPTQGCSELPDEEQSGS